MAISNKTYNNVINTLARLGEYHDQISTVSVGDIYDINLEKMELFPLLHINPVNVTTGDSELVYNFQIFICDLVSEKSLEGVDDINFPIYFTQDQFTIEPFQERFDNLLCGYVFQIGVKVMNDFDTCVIPVTDLGAGY